MLKIPEGGGAGLSAPVITQRYVLDNHLGSASLELDESASIISYEEYYPYGSTSYQSGNSTSEVQRKRYRYTGKEKDEESGLYYHGARYYAAWLGRWTASDPIGVEGGINLYQYSNSNPAMFSDPSGNEPEYYSSSSSATSVASKSSSMAPEPPPEVNPYRESIEKAIDEYEPTQEYFERKEQLLNKLDNLEASSAKTKSRGISSVKSQLAMLESQNNSRLVEYLGEKYQTDQSFKDEVDKFNLFEMGERDKYVLEDRTGRAIRTSMNRLKSEIKSGLRDMALGTLGGYVAGKMATRFAGWLLNGRSIGGATNLNGGALRKSDDFIPILNEEAEALSFDPEVNTIKSQAEELIPKNANKNRITLRSPSQKLEIDLAGKEHAGVPTPHTKNSPRNLKAPKQPAYNTKNSPVKPTTQQEIRTVRKYLERKGR